MKKSVIAAALMSAMSLSMAPLASQAQSDPAQSSPMDSESSLSNKSFLDLDRNLDGLISIDEAESHPALKSEFQQADTNRNSHVDLSEFSAFIAKNEGKDLKQPTDKMSSFDSLDADKDGRVSQREADVNPMLSEQYTSVDLDSDGFISATEFSAFETRQGGETSTKSSGGQPVDFNQLDTNKDGLLTLPEVKGRQPIEQQFSTIDGNRDGMVSRQEYQSAMASEAPTPQISFQSLDTNKNGWISPAEANVDPTVSGQFSVIDKDRNGFIDKSEFSAFETSQGSGGSPTPQ